MIFILQIFIVMWLSGNRSSSASHRRSGHGIGIEISPPRISTYLAFCFGAISSSIAGSIAVSSRATTNFTFSAFECRCYHFRGSRLARAKYHQSAGRSIGRTWKTRAFGHVHRVSMFSAKYVSRRGRCASTKQSRSASRRFGDGDPFAWIG